MPFLGNRELKYIAHIRCFPSDMIDNASKLGADLLIVSYQQGEKNIAGFQFFRNCLKIEAYGKWDPAHETFV